MKNNNILEYKGYHTKIVFNSADFVLRGKIEGINDLVDFECEDVKDVEKEFHAAVDDYLQFCEEVGKTPEKEYKGTFNVRIDPALHKKLANIAMKNGDTLNASVEKAISSYVYNEKRISEHFLHRGKILKDLKNESIYRYEGENYYNSNVVRFKQKCGYEM